MRQTILCALLAIVWFATVDHQNADAQTKESKRWAILIGVDEYNAASDLKYSGADMRALRTQLMASGFAEKDIFLLHDDAKKKYLPFKSNIEKQLELVLKLCAEDDLVLVVFSGHGVQLGEDSYLCPTDAVLDDPESLVSLDWVYRKLNQSQAALRLLVVDACRNDPHDGGKKSLDGQKNVNKAFSKSLEERPPEGIVLLTSCAAGEISMEDPKFGHGVFTHYLLQAMRGDGDKDKNGRISVGELAMYAGYETKRYVARRFSESQRPGLRGDTTIEALNFEFANASTWTNSIGMKLVQIPAGEFLMGSGKSAAEIARQFDSKAEYYEDEHPQHRVRLSKPYYLGSHEVTIGEFGQFVQAKGYKTEAERDGEGGWGWNEATGKLEGRDPKYTWQSTGWKQTDAHPVVNVSWNDAVAFCAWLSQKDGRKYRLPTEAEWEYACRAGTTTMYQHGDDPEGLVRVGNVADETAKSKLTNYQSTSYLAARDGHVFTAPVGSYAANAWGLYDMHGNVYEWCQDWYGADYYGNSAGTDPTGPSSGSSRVLRGGSWGGSPRDCRSALRDWDAPTYRHLGLGFRVVCALD